MGWALILSRAIAPHSAWTSVVKMIFRDSNSPKLANTLRKRDLRQRQNLDVEARWATESNSVKWRTQKDFAGAVEIGWVSGTEFATGWSLQRKAVPSASHGGHTCCRGQRPRDLSEICIQISDDLKPALTPPCCETLRVSHGTIA
jgi:hypothetical protein